MLIAVIGTGYVGLVSGACFADFGHTVVCVDQDEAKIVSLQGGDMPIYEPGLPELVASNVQQGRLSFTTNLPAALRGTDVVFLAVGTPSRAEDGHADLRHVYAAAREVAEALTQSCVVVTKSTVPVGSGDEVERIIRELRPDLDVPVVSNPEFLREGAAIRDFKIPDRIVVGTSDERARQVMAELYRPLYLNAAPILHTSRRTAELIKYAANAFLATKISFINEVADLCETLGADVQDVARGIGLDNRIGTKFLHPGPGFGGSCFPKDTLALIRIAQDNKTALRVVEATVAVNEQRKRAMVHKVAAVLEGDLRNRTIAVLGLTFKPNTDDMREAPSIALITALRDKGAEIRVYDPAGMEQARRVLGEVTYCDGPYSAAEGAHALVIVTEWEQFRALDLRRLKRVMAKAAIVDLRNVYRPDDIAAAGFLYESIGQRRSEHRAVAPAAARNAPAAKIEVLRSPDRDSERMLDRPSRRGSRS